LLPTSSGWNRIKTKGEPADLTRANLEGRDLSRSNLLGTRLHGANLQGAILDGTIFREADLQAADLSAATSLLSEQLAGANLCHAILPKEILGSDELATVTETSRSAQTLLWSMLGACIYMADHLDHDGRRGHKLPMSRISSISQHWPRS
jgi:uncharacterized protein YjbI with pentapeptide repeats